MTQHIGIVACSAEGAALCYRTVALEGAHLLGTHDHPEVSMHTHPLARYMERIYADDWAGVADLMLSSADKLAKAGADFLICPDNTIHQAFGPVEQRSPRPWLHIAQEVANEARRSHFKRLGVLGTRYLMEGPVYPEKFSCPKRARSQDVLSIPGGLDGWVWRYRFARHAPIAFISATTFSI